MAAEHPDRFARLFIANGFLPIADRPVPMAFRIWRAFAKYSPVLSAGWLVDRATVHPVPPAVRAGYDAPFPDRSYQAGARAFPRLVPTSPKDPAVPANRAAWEVLGHWLCKSEHCSEVVYALAGVAGSLRSPASAATFRAAKSADRDRPCSPNWRSPAATC